MKRAFLIAALWIGAAEYLIHLFSLRRWLGHVEIGRSKLVVNGFEKLAQLRDCRAAMAEGVLLRRR